MFFHKLIAKSYISANINHIFNSHNIIWVLLKDKCALCGFYLHAKSRYLFAERALGDGIVLDGKVWVVREVN
ncbi:MAG: hypothetical protein EA412_00260 [Chitinophagaceae bacterium]|nr:MAG: hypothetical protein EA412_00260 [Chitinophagaceae bacterium]